MERNDLATPIKLHPNGEELGISTPSGGVIFNPFHREFMSRLGQVAFSPGIFAYNQSPATKDGSRKSTPNRLSIPFVLSPDTQGILFPAEIDENPILQLKLQEKLETQCDDDFQDTIHSFFKSHLIAPSPDANEYTVDNYHRNTLHRTSSMIPTVTPKMKRKPTCQADPTPIILNEVAVQTALSVPPDFDLDSLIQRALEGDDNTNFNTTSNAPVTHDCQTEPEDLSITANSSVLDGIKRQTVGQLSFSACAVQRAVDEDSNCQSFVCMSCHKPHPVSQYGRRSLFSDSSSVPDEAGQLNQRTLICGDTYPVSQPVHSTYLSSSTIEGTGDSGSGRVESESEDIGSLLEQSNPSRQTMLFGSSAMEEPDGHVLCGRGVAGSATGYKEFVSHRSSEAHATDWSPMDKTNPRAQSIDNPKSLSLKIGKSSPDILTLTSPCMFHSERGFDSPNLSPILPSKAFTSPNEDPVDSVHNPPPSACLFGGRSESVSPIRMVSCSSKTLEHSLMDDS